MMTRGLALPGVIACLLVAAAHAQSPAMPDPKEISGIPLPMPDVPIGTVTVRVLRGSFAKNIAGQDVTLTVDGTPRSGKTNEQGRAEFSGLRPGSRVRATTAVDGATLESQEFPVPSSGGIRVVLVAVDPEIEQRAAEDRKLAAGPAQRGMVVLGEQTRFVIEMGDAALSVFNILQIVNTARTPVEPPQPVVFDVPADAGAPEILDGSSRQASVANRQVIVAGPFAPGVTLVQFAYSMPYSGANLTLEQRMPVALNQVAVMAQKVGDMHVASPQIASHREMAAEGQTYIVAEGPAIGSGGVLTLNFTQLPHAATWPRNLALALAGLILAAGIGYSARGRPAATDTGRTKLETKRERLFEELTSLERQHRDRTIDPERYRIRRRDLMASLERVYADLDSLDGTAQAWTSHP
jgi:hypothetical protein